MQRFGSLVQADAAAFVHASAQVYGKVRLEEGSSLWPNAVIRAEAHEVVLGRYSNLQDNAVLHVGGSCGVSIGAWCSIAHRAVVHGARIGDNCLVAIGATVMDGAVIGENSIVAGHAIVSEGMQVPPNSIVAGVPAKIVKPRNNWVGNRLNAWLYHRNALAYARGEHRAWDGPEAEAAMAEERRRLEAMFAEMQTAAE